MSPITEIYIKLDSEWTWHSENFSGLVLGIKEKGVLLAGIRAEQVKAESLWELRHPIHKSVHFRARLQNSSTKEGVALEHLEDLEHSPLRFGTLLAIIRKSQHIHLSQHEDVEASDRFTGFEHFDFLPSALPDFDPEQADITANLFGRTFAAPLLITGMTGGLEQGASINQRLSRAAAKLGIPFGVGSQRLALDDTEHAAIFQVKKYAPKVFLIGNLGMTQLLLKDYRERCLRAVDMIQADALAIHLNSLQELVQVEGDRHFAGIRNRLECLAKDFPVPLLLKEVGVGIDAKTALWLDQIGIQGIDVGGSGGTSWSHIEGLRSSHESTRQLGKLFRNFGIPTAFSLQQTRSSVTRASVIATGGIRDGLMVAKAVALGADMAGIGLPLLRAALASEDRIEELLDYYLRGLRITMCVTGSRCLSDLKHSLVPSYRLREKVARSALDSDR